MLGFPVSLAARGGHVIASGQWDVRRSVLGALSVEERGGTGSLCPEGSALQPPVTTVERKLMDRTATELTPLPTSCCLRKIYFSLFKLHLMSFLFFVAKKSILHMYFYPINLHNYPKGEVYLFPHYRQEN